MAKPKRQRPPASPSPTLPPQQGQPAQPSGSLTQYRASLEAYQGVIPHPDLMARWEAVIPGSAERIFQMVENQERHRIHLEEAAVRAEIRSGYMGVVAALVVALAAMGTSAFIAWVGQPVAGAGLGGATLVALVGAFLKANNDRRQERIEKARLMAGSR